MKKGGEATFVGVDGLLGLRWGRCAALSSFVEMALRPVRQGFSMKPGENDVAIAAKARRTRVRSIWLDWTVVR